MRDSDAVTVISAPALCGRFEASVRAGCDGVVASDGDGTLWRGDVGDALFDTVLDEAGLRPEAREALAVEAAAYGLEPTGDANALGHALREAYREGRYDEGRYFAMQTWSFAGWEERELSAKCAEVLHAFAFDAAVRPAMRRVVDWCRGHRVPFLLVSASPEAIVLEAARRLRLDEHRVFAMRPAMRGGVVLPELSATPTYGPGKVTRLTEHLGDAPLLAAFGDNTWDAAMLERAAYPVMVAPKPGLRERLVGVDGVFDLEAP